VYTCPLPKKSSKQAGDVADASALFVNKRANRMKVLVHDGTCLPAAGDGHGALEAAAGAPIEMASVFADMVVPL
jgi:hypothetical protein